MKFLYLIFIMFYSITMLAIEKAVLRNDVIVPKYLLEKTSKMLLTFENDSKALRDLSKSSCSRDWVINATHLDRFEKVGLMEKGRFVSWQVKEIIYCSISLFPVSRLISPLKLVHEKKVTLKSGKQVDAALYNRVMNFIGIKSLVRDNVFFDIMYRAIQDKAYPLAEDTVEQLKQQELFNNETHDIKPEVALVLKEAIVCNEPKKFSIVDPRGCWPID